MDELTLAREIHIQAASEKIYIRSVGNPDADDVVILIHGGPGLSHLYLRDLEQLASDQFMVVSYDQRGCSRSITTTIQDGEIKEQPGKVPDHLDLQSYAQDLEAVRRAVAGQKKVHLLAHSWGGGVAMSYLVHYPEHVRSLILVNCLPPTWSGTQAGLSRLNAQIEVFQQQGIIPKELSTDPVECLAQILPAYSPHFDPSGLDFEFENTPGINEQTWKDVKDFDMHAQLASFDRPILIFFGTEDAFGTEWVEETKAAFVNADLTVKLVPGCGHFGWLERPGIFYTTIRDFLA